MKILWNVGKAASNHQKHGVSFEEELVRGKYTARLAQETNVVMLEPDIAAAFPNDQAVNEALRGLLEVAATTARLTQLVRKRRAG